MKEKNNKFEGTLTLKNPIMIDGKKVKEVTYNSNEIDGILFATAEAKKKAAAGMKNTTITPAAEFDVGLHLYLGFAAIVAVNPSYDFAGAGTTGKRLRRAYRDYARVYHTSTSDLERKRVTDFILEYAEAAEDLAEERKRQEKKRPPISRRPKHVKRR